MKKKAAIRWSVGKDRGKWRIRGPRNSRPATKAEIWFHHKLERLKREVQEMRDQVNAVDHAIQARSLSIEIGRRAQRIADAVELAKEAAALLRVGESDSAAQRIDQLEEAVEGFEEITRLAKEQLGSNKDGS